MKVAMLSPYHSGAIKGNAGDVLNLPDDIAKRLIEEGNAGIPGACTVTRAMASKPSVEIPITKKLTPNATQGANPQTR